MVQEGDIGQWNEGGTLSLIDRCVLRSRDHLVFFCADAICVARLKNLVKMQGGEVCF